MRNSKKLMAGILAAMLAVSAAACGSTTSTEPTEKTQQTENKADVKQVSIKKVTTLQAGDNQIYVCYPNDNITDSSPVKTTCTAPVLMVYGDGAMTEDQASAYATESGLAAIAAENGGSVIIVNPVSDKWSDSDAASYSALVSMISDSSTDPAEDGIINALNYFTQETEQKILGTTQKIYVYGLDSGADFVAANILKTISGEQTYGDGVTITFNNTCSGVTLEGLSDASTVEENDIPVVSIGNSDEVNTALKNVCGSVDVEDTADYPSQYAQVIGNYRRQAGVLLPIYNWADEGIQENIETFTVNTAADNVTFAGQATHDVNVVTYYADDLDVKSGNVPLVLCFHGGGNTALYEAQATEWPLIGKDNGFITASVDLHYPNCSATEIVDIIKQLEDEYSIDTSRIYASGFSMGGCQSWDLFEQYPEIFAGLAPMDATNELGLNSFGNPVENANTDTITPVFYVGGEMSPLPELPFQDQKCIDRVKYAFGVNKVTADYNVALEDKDNWANPIWGISGDLSYSVTDKKAFTDSTLDVELFASADGKYYTALACAGNQSHEVYARNSHAAWDFLSQFSRNEDGSIQINDVTYELPSDDGTISDNSYNTK